ncbi:triphosphoribosyl-dephospho-CoA synthase [Trinickia sp. LjRoot230]|uniref:triphosphoribosyl-dephospho-CoA synthase n=1 Tax=Trinickia sp. LjRoot230 TaxID=3342288 RepID=UPI003ECDDD8F
MRENATNAVDARIADARNAFITACRLDIEVAKPGNVSIASAGHGMVAAQFVASAEAAAAPLFRHGARVGTRIFDAVTATRAAVDCNTNLGIVLLVAPLAAALEHCGAAPDASTWRAATEQVLATLDIDDARSAFRAIALANPGGLGDAPEQSVHAPPTMGLRAAMQLAAERDSIARQYATGFADIFEAGLTAAAATTSPRGREIATLEVYFAFLTGWLDSHIVRKHGAALAQSVTAAARQTHAAWRDCMTTSPDESHATLAQWDARLKRDGLNPGTSADLTVATLFVALSLDGKHRPR